MNKLKKKILIMKKNLKNGTIFQKMLKDSIDLAVSILTSQKRNEDEEIHEEKIKELIEEIMEEKIKLLGSYLNKE